MKVVAVAAIVDAGLPGKIRMLADRSPERVPRQGSHNFVGTESNGNKFQLSRLVIKAHTLRDIPLIATT